MAAALELRDNSSGDWQRRLAHESRDVKAVGDLLALVRIGRADRGLCGTGRWASPPRACGAGTKLIRWCLDAWILLNHRALARIRKIFGTWKRNYGLRRMRWRWLAKAACQIRFTAIAQVIGRGFDIRRAVAATYATT